MMIGSNAPPGMWGEAILYTAYIINNKPARQGSRATRDNPFYQQADPTKPPSRIIKWGCTEYALRTEHNSKELRRSKVMLGIFVGWNKRRKSYRIVKPPHYTMIKYSGHVVFNEDECLWSQRKQDNTALERTEFMVDNRQCRHPIYVADEADFELDQEPETAPIAISRSRRAWTPSSAALENLAQGAPAPPTYGGDAHLTGDYNMVVVSGERLEQAFASMGTVTDPSSWIDALKRPEHQQWIQGGKKHYDQLNNFGTLGKPIPVTELPAGTKTVRGGDVFTTKRSGERRWRMVIKGFLMQPGIHYNETFAPVVLITTLRILLVLMTMRDWNDVQGDAPSAFMQPKIDTVIYMLPTATYRYFSKELRDLEQLHGVGKVAMQVLKGIPGIPQGSRLWNVLLHKLLTALAFVRSKVDYGLYIWHSDVNGADGKIFLVIWVDDIFMFYHKQLKQRADYVWNVLRKEIKLKEQQPIGDYLGCVINRDREGRKTFVSQELSIMALQKKLGLDAEKSSADTPIDPNIKLTRADIPPKDEQRVRADELRRYQSSVASLIYFSQWTRPDLSYAVGVLARFMRAKTDHDAAEKQLKRALHYLFRSAKFGLLYDFSGDASGNISRGIYGYYDSSFADCPDSRRSTGGHVIFWFGCPVAWLSKLHPYVTTSTTHSEYIAGAVCARECAFHVNLAEEIGLGRPTIHLKSDSQGCIAQCYNPTNRNATKHVDVADHYIREQVERKRITVSYCSTSVMIADIFTKALSRQIFAKHCQELIATQD